VTGEKYEARTSKWLNLNISIVPSNNTRDTRTHGHQLTDIVVKLIKNIFISTNYLWASQRIDTIQRIHSSTRYVNPT
jgi:hypothetical protein